MQRGGLVTDTNCGCGSRLEATHHFRTSSAIAKLKVYAAVCTCKCKFDNIHHPRFSAKCLIGESMEGLDTHWYIMPSLSTANTEANACCAAVQGTFRSGEQECSHGLGLQRSKYCIQRSLPAQKSRNVYVFGDCEGVSAVLNGDSQVPAGASHAPEQVGLPLRRDGPADSLPVCPVCHQGDGKQCLLSTTHIPTLTCTAATPILPDVTSRR